MNDLNKARENFIKKLKEEDKSQSTIVAYNKDIEQLSEYLLEEAVVNTQDIKIEHLKGFTEELAEKGYTKKSISRKINAIRTYISFLFEEGDVSVDISDQLKHPKIQPKAPRILSKLEYRALRDASRRNVRTYSMIEVLLQTGITISELSGIELDHVHVENGLGTLFIPARGSKDSRTVPLNEAAVGAIKEYLNEKRPTMDGAEHLFITKTGNPMLVRNIRSTINRAFKRAGVEDATVNDIRHTFAAHHLENGLSIIKLSKILGHKRVSTTERYLDYVEKPEKTERTEISVL